MLRRSGPILAAFAAIACGDNLRNPAVEGVVFEDTDGDGVMDPDEAPLPGVTVYIDHDDDGDLDPWDFTAVTAADGSYRIELDHPRDYAIRHVVPFGYASVSGGEPRRRDGPAAHIIGGVEAGELEYPFMAAVGALSGDRFAQFCGGVLASPSFVVTAAHCSFLPPDIEIGVLLGSNDASAGIVRAVSAVSIHPDFADSVVEGNDIAVWRLAEPIDPLFAPGVRTVELASDDTVELTAPGVLATTIGWGVADNDSDRLQEVHLPIASDTDCAAAYPDVASFDTQICAGVPEGGIDSCQGDSGGPLLVRDADRGVWVHAGVTSWGQGCALPGYPGIYARTSALSEWARSAMSEPSRVYRMSIRGEAVRADFGDRPTLLPMVGTIDPRIQLAGIEVAGASAGAVPADTAVALDYTILGDPGAGALSCRLDADGPGPLAEVATPCAVGANTATHSGYADGAYRADLIADLGDGATTRRSAFIVAGTPSSDTAAGALLPSDSIDPDFPGSTYYIDYYELTGTSEGALAILEVDAEFDSYLVLYDADVRTATGGGFLGSISALHRFFPEPGRRYLLGISTFSEAEIGDYTVELINNGALTPVTL